MIYVSETIHKQLIKLKNEDCGFIHGKENEMNKICKIKNTSSNFNEYKMKKINVLSFVFRNFWSFLFLKCNWMIYHVHSYNGYLSELDRKNMILKVVYIIIFKDELYLYQKLEKNKEAETLRYKIKKDAK